MDQAVTEEVRIMGRLERRVSPRKSGRASGGRNGRCGCSEAGMWVRGRQETQARVGSVKRNRGSREV